MTIQLTDEQGDLIWGDLAENLARLAEEEFINEIWPAMLAASNG